MIHALSESVAPIHAAFAAEWPEAVIFDLLDSSLSRDLAHTQALDAVMIDRFLTLARYAEATSGEGGSTAAILFTCSAFGPAIDAVKAAVSVPVLRPNEAAFEAAIERGGDIGLLVTFPPSLPALQRELHEMAARRGAVIRVHGRVVDGALDALKSGDGDLHDRLVAQASAQLPQLDSLILGQFSMARAASRIEVREGCEILTTPACAVTKLRDVLSRAATPRKARW